MVPNFCLFAVYFSRGTLPTKKETRREHLAEGPRKPQKPPQIAMGQNPVPPVNIPIATKKDQAGWCTYPKMAPLVLAHSQIAAALELPLEPYASLAWPESGAPLAGEVVDLGAVGATGLADGARAVAVMPKPPFFSGWSSHEP